MSDLANARFLTAAEEQQLRTISRRYLRAGLHEWQLVERLLAEVHLLRLTIRQVTFGLPRIDLADLPEGVLPRLLLLPPVPDHLTLTRWPNHSQLDHYNIQPLALDGPAHEHNCPTCDFPWRCTIHPTICSAGDLHCDDCWPAERRRRARALIREQAPR